MSHAQAVARLWAAPRLRCEVGTATIAEPMGGPRLGGKHCSLHGGQPQVRLLARDPLARSPACLAACPQAPLHTPLARPTGLVSGRRSSPRGGQAEAPRSA